MGKRRYDLYAWCIFLIVCPIWRTSAQRISFIEAAYKPMCAAEVMKMPIPERSLRLVRVLVMTSERKFTEYPLPAARFLLTDPNFNSSRRTVLYAHGYFQNATLYPSNLISGAYLSMNNTNVLMLNSFPLLSLNYFGSVAAVTAIGTTIGDQLFAMTEAGFNVSTLVILGHSLGAHIVGFAGKQFKKRSGRKLPYIVGMDPAGPCYLDVPPERRLDKTDAEFVQVVHTNAGTLGMMNPIGHVNFYPNGGRMQPTKFPIVPNFISSHERSVELWYSSVLNPNKFFGVKCRRLLDVDLRRCNEIGTIKAIFGPNLDRKVRGDFLFYTSSTSPYYID